MADRVIVFDAKNSTEHDRWEMAVFMTALRGELGRAEAEKIVNKDWPEPKGGNDG